MKQKAEKFLNTALGGNMNLATLKPLALIEIMTAFAEIEVAAINYTRCSTDLPTSTQLLSDCKKRFKELEGKGNLDYRSYRNGYLDSFSKNVVSKIK